MRKNLITKTAVLAMTAALLLPATVYAAPPTTAPTAMSVKQDGKTHKVFVFGTSLALVSTDGSIEISTMGPVGRVDVMIDGDLYKNVASIDIPAGQQTKMVLDEGSVLVKNVTPETGAAVKKQISDAYAAGATTVDLASLTDVTAYKVNENGTLADAAGSTVSAAATGVSVSSTEAASASFTAEIKEIVVKEAIAAAETANGTVAAAPVQEVKEEKKDSSSSSSSTTTPPADDDDKENGGGNTGDGGDENGGNGNEQPGDNNNNGGNNNEPGNTGDNNDSNNTSTTPPAQSGEGNEES